MNKRYLLIFTIAFLLIACEADLKNIDTAVETASVTLKIANNTESRSILPEVTDILSYSVTLHNKTYSDIECTSTFKNSSAITIDSVLVGTYTVTVDGCSDEEGTVKVATGETELTVSANGDNTASVTLDWLDEGEGSFSVDINWSDLTKGDNLLYKAVTNRSLGFQAWDTENKKPFNNAGIQWVGEDGFTAKKYTYTQTDIPTQKDKRSTNISFRVYSKIDDADQVIAETFYTTVTIFANITSYPDGNESFSLKNENIVYYLKNVTGVTSSLNTEDSAKKIDITWTYPALDDGSYLLKAWITNNNTNEIVGTEKNIEYSVLNTVVTGDTTATFDGLAPDNSYTVHFVNYTNDTNLVYSYSAEATPLTEIKTKVKVTSISFQSGFKTSYVMGDSVTVNANIAPYDATVASYTVSVSPELTVSDNSITFDKSGDYTITLTSDDENAVERAASQTVTVKLATPEDFTLEKTSEGMALTWSAVEGATSYSIRKIFEGGEETLTAADTSYTDSSVKTGVEYTYSVKAVRDDDRKFDSDYSEEKKEKITNTFITVTAPTNLTSENFKPILEKALENQFVTNLKGITVTIDTSSSTLLSAEGTAFSWLLNGEEIGEKNSRTVDVDKSNVSINAHETTNSLQLVVTSGGVSYSASANVHYIESDPGDLTITTTDSTVRYNEPLQLETATTNNVECAISWTSSDPSIATVDSNGIVTALVDGETAITATVVATGKSTTKTIKTYIPVKSIKITNNCAFLLADWKLTDYGRSSYTSTTLGLSFVGENDKEASAAAREKITWSISGGCASVNSGTVSSYGNSNGGTATITVTSTENNLITDTTSISVYKFDIYDNIGGNVITDKNFEIKIWKGGKTVYALVSESATNVGTFGYSWSTSTVGGLTLDIDERGTSYNPKIGDNTAYTHTVTVSISFGGKEVASLYFKRTS